jgi:hypothetical protein
MANIYIYILRCGALDRLRPGSVPTSSTPYLNDVSTKLLSDTDVCEFDAVIIVDHPGVSSNIIPSLLPYYFLFRLKKSLILNSYSKLHASDLRSLSPSSSLATHLQDSPSSLQLPYVRLPPANSNFLQDLADKLAGLCGAQRLALPLDSVAASLTPSSKTFVSFSSLSYPHLRLILPNLYLGPSAFFHYPCQL